MKQALSWPGMLRLRPREKLDSIINASVDSHSRKPHSVYEDIEHCYGGPYVELFARNRRDDWESWGNELERLTGMGLEARIVQ